MIKMYKVGERVIEILALFPLLLVGFLSLWYRNTISMDIIETSTIQENGLGIAVLVVVGLGGLMVLYYVLKKFPETWLFVICAVLYLVAGVYLVSNIQMQLRFDSGICYWNAMYYVEGEYINLQVGEYFYKNPHQLGLVAYNCLLLLVSKNENFIYYMNLFWIIIGNFFMWRTSMLVCKENEMIRKITIVFSFLFLPQFFYLFFAYGQVPGLGCLLISIFFFVYSLEKENMWLGLVSGIFIGGACFLRINYVIAAIAMVIIYSLHFFKTKRKENFFILIFMIICIIMPRVMVNSYFEKVADTDLGNGMPSTLYIAMGLQENDEPWRANGWYNGFNDSTYLSNAADADISNEIAKQAIRERIIIFANNPEYTYSFFKEKIITTWCEPTFQSIWSGPLICMGCATEKEWLVDLYSGGGLFIKLSFVMNVFNVVIFALAILYVLKILYKKKSMDNFSLFGILFFLGGFLFHIFWETKSQYVYPYVVCLLPVAAYGMDAMWSGVVHKIEKYRMTKKI